MSGPGDAVPMFTILIIVLSKADVYEGAKAFRQHGEISRPFHSSTQLIKVLNSAVVRHRRYLARQFQDILESQFDISANTSR